MTTTALVVKDAEVMQVAAQHTEVLPAMSWQEMLTMGNELVRTGFLPDSIKTGAQAAAIILAGREMGIPPMRAFRTLYIYKGKIDEYADSQLARFKQKGGRATFQHDRCIFDGCKAKRGPKTERHPNGEPPTHLDAEHAALWCRHPNGDEHVETFTMADAKASGLADTNQNYKRNPKAMLRSRAITNGLKSVGWEDAVGTYDPSEVETFAQEPVAHPPVPEIMKMDAEAIRVAIGKELDRIGVPAEQREERTLRINGGLPIRTIGQARDVLLVLQDLDSAPLDVGGDEQSGDVQPNNVQE